MLGAVTHTQHLAQLAEAPRGQAVAAWKAHVFRLQLVVQLANTVAVVRVAVVVLAVAVQHDLVCPRVYLIGRSPYGRQTAGDERLAQSFWRDRQIAGRAEAPEALAEDAPSVDLQLAADPLRVADDRVGSEMREVLGLLPRSHSWQRANGR